jgi:hypothetical protein
MQSSLLIVLFEFCGLKSTLFVFFIKTKKNAFILNKILKWWNNKQNSWEKNSNFYLRNIWANNNKRRRRIYVDKRKERSFVFVWSAQQIFVLSTLIKQSNELLSMKITKLSIERSTNSDRATKIYD